MTARAFTNRKEQQVLNQVFSRIKLTIDNLFALTKDWHSKSHELLIYFGLEINFYQKDMLALEQDILTTTGINIRKTTSATCNIDGELTVTIHTFNGMYILSECLIILYNSGSVF